MSRVGDAVGTRYRGARRRTRRFFIDTENTNIVLGLVAVAVVLSLAIPLAFPELKRSGPSCFDLNSPPGGNRRSMLAENGDTRQDLALIVDIDANQSNNDGDPMLRVGEPLIVDVVFRNDDIGAITFYILEDEEAVGPPASPSSIAGIYLEITNSATDQVYSDSQRQGLPPNLQSFVLEDLRVLQARRRCSVRLTFTPQQLQGMNMGIGEYEIRAYYSNPNRGPLPPPSSNTPTATPMFVDQGVWDGSINSPIVRFEISP